MYQFFTKSILPAAIIIASFPAAIFSFWPGHAQAQPVPVAVNPDVHRDHGCSGRARREFLQVLERHRWRLAESCGGSGPSRKRFVAAWYVL
ncbi:MAG TPA: hypothetical protein VEV41_27280, partial [Terriglobales bacterium]|nr:hypothetical protein [Terriglobales bacterium]